MKKSLILVWVLCLVLGGSSISYADTTSVSKVVFREMNGDVNSVLLKDVRFYDENNTLISSGDVIRDERLVAETDVFTITPSSTYDNLSYYPLGAFDTSQNNKIWISGGRNANINQSLIVDFKENKSMNKIEFITRGHSNSNHDITGLFYMDVYDDLGNISTYEVNSETSYNEVISINLKPYLPALTLDVESSGYEVAGGETFQVNVKLSGATNIFAEDITVSYDKEMFELVGSTVSDTAAYKIYYTNISTTGSATFIVASTNKNYGITGDANILSLTFKSRGKAGKSDIKVASGLVANNNGNEIEPSLLGKTYTVLKGYIDVNGDDEFTLGDLAIASYYVNEPSISWGIYTPDIDNDGSVADHDLELIVAELMK